jgi:hypothetical protein
MSFKIFETDQYTLKIREDADYLECTIKEGVTIDEELILETKAVIERYRPDTKFFVLSEGVGFFRITNKARKMTATKEYSSHMAAVAFHTDYISLKLLVDLYNQINKPVVETKLFNDRESAKEWLEKEMNKTKIEIKIANYHQ